MRTIIPIPPIKSNRTAYSEDYLYKTRCFWPCPCGGSVPDAPSHCQYAKRRGKKKVIDVLMLSIVSGPVKNTPIVQHIRK